MTSTVTTVTRPAHGCDPELRDSLRAGARQAADIAVRRAARERYNAAENRQAYDAAVARAIAKGIRETIPLLAKVYDLGAHFDNGGIVWPCQHLLAERCRVSVRTIRRWIKKLEDDRIVRVWRQRPHRDDHGRWTRKTNRYLIPLRDRARASAQFAPRGHARPVDPSLHRKGAGDRATAPLPALLDSSFLQQETVEVIPRTVSASRFAALRAKLHA